MKIDSDATEVRRSRPMLVQELVEGFDDWAKWLRSLLPTLQVSTTAPSETLLLTEGEDAAADSCSLPPQCPDEDRWQDDGGESAETV